MQESTGTFFPPLQALATTSLLFALNQTLRTKQWLKPIYHSHLIAMKENVLTFICFSSISFFSNTQTFSENTMAIAERHLNCMCTKTNKSQGPIPIRVTSNESYFQ